MIDDNIQPFHTGVKWDRNTTWVMSEAVRVEEIWSAVASCITPAELTSVNIRKINKEFLTELIRLLTHLGYDRQMV